VRPRALTRTAALVAILAQGGCGLPRWPVQADLSSGFGVRFRGVRPDVHHGVDLDVPTGTPVGAMAGGRVRFTGVMSGFGNVVWIDHAAGMLSIYAHLSEIGVTEGQSVAPGDIVGLSGASGAVTAPHLHFEVWRWGRPVDPIPVLGGRPR
jgi:murein DD-endopeptidase MepM/ murein hydrolase activator NlpD